MSMFSIIILLSLRVYHFYKCTQFTKIHPKNFPKQNSDIDWAAFISECHVILFLYFVPRHNYLLSWSFSISQIQNLTFYEVNFDKKFHTYLLMYTNIIIEQ